VWINNVHILSSLGSAQGPGAGIININPHSSMIREAKRGSQDR